MYVTIVMSEKGQRPKLPALEVKQNRTNGEKENGLVPEYLFAAHLVLLKKVSVIAQSKGVIIIYEDFLRSYVSHYTKHRSNYNI